MIKFKTQPPASAKKVRAEEESSGVYSSYEEYSATLSEFVAAILNSSQLIHQTNHPLYTTTPAIKNHTPRQYIPEQYYTRQSYQSSNKLVLSPSTGMSRIWRRETTFKIAQDTRNCRNHLQTTQIKDIAGENLFLRHNPRGA